MDRQELNGNQLVFGLDIGTRNVVGTVGYREEDLTFHVIAQYVKEHTTRSMIDGQIHDIGKVGKTISDVKKQLEEQIQIPLHEVCIAAAGRGGGAQPRPCTCICAIRATARSLKSRKAAGRG